MYTLKKLELLGFKSFADRSRLEFSDGLAAIVGPNGCGKSNLADAISWVLGEQSARLLRGERMADVIFNGTGTRPPTSMAEVRMTLVDPEYIQAGLSEEECNDEVAAGRREAATCASANPPGRAPSPQDAGEESPWATGTASVAAMSPSPQNAGEVTGAEAAGNEDESAAAGPSKLRHRAGEIIVTRRLFRSGESEYLINGEACRLRDIQDLFMGTGLGPESYAIIEQGRIGQVLSSKPSDRRLILEEAAGVSKFKARKRLAEAKLESARQNLTRITDILEEVTTRVNSLKRQASKARRYKELQAEFRGRQKVILASRLLVLEAECERLRQELIVIQQACASAAHQLEALEQEQKSVGMKHEELESYLTHLRKRLAQGDLERERLNSRLEQVRQQTSGLDARSEEALRESGELQTKLTRLEQETAERARQAEQFRQEGKRAEQALGQLLAQQEATGAQLSIAEDELEVWRQALLAAVSRGAELRNQLVQVEEAGLAVDRQAARAEAEKLKVEREYQRLAAEREALISEQQRVASALAELAQAVTRVSADLEQTRAEELARRSKFDALRHECLVCVARKQALEESLATRAYSTESVRRLLAGDIPINGDNFRPLGLLADYVEVSPGYEEVVEEFLKPELECVVVERHEQARSGIALLRSEGTGRSSFFVTQVRSNGYANGDDEKVRSEGGVVAPVRDLVRFEQSLGLNGDPALPALANAYLVEDAAAAERLAGSYPECHFLTSTGEHYHHRLVSGGKGGSAGPLALRREFRELERRAKELEVNVRAAETTLAEVAARATRLEEELGNVTAAKVEAEKKAAVASEKFRQTYESWERAQGQLQALQSEAAVLRRERGIAEERQASLRVELAAAAEEKIRCEEAIAQASQGVREFRAQLDRLALELAEAQSEARALEERVHAADAEAGRYQTVAEDLRNRLTRLAQQKENWCEEREQLSRESASQQTRLQLLEAEQESARRESNSLEEESQALRGERDAARQRVDDARAKLDAQRENRSEAEVALARAESDRGHHARLCREELRAEPEALQAELAPEAALAGEALQAAEEELRQLKERIENLGPVNMMALEELQEAEERFSFLETQRQDLLVSIEDTAQAIREIDQVSRQQFLEAFQAINGYFAESFRTLFGGGVGEMRLTDEADPDSGIDIVAQPPGKRLQNVLLLSGGEKALAALALLIALFRYTPSPFCVLDEVDAPLDESNIDRFTRLIQHMSRHTQFILITHNKRTMEIAPVMYGVTMEDPGVSKLVSVRFDALAPEPVVVPA